MKRTLILFLLFLLLGAGALWYLMNPEEDKTTLLAYERAFAVENTDLIHRIFLADREGGKVTLERKKDYWLFDGQYRARPNAIENLLDAIRRIQVKYKPPEAAVDGMVKDLASKGIKVELYDKNGELIKVYYVGGATADERGTYMIMDQAEQPYVVSIPAWEGNVRFRYNLKGEDWRDKTVFAFQPEQIRSVTIEYPKQKNKSFRLHRVSDDFEITAYYDITPKIRRPYKKGSADVFLTGFESLVAEAFENNNPRRDSIRRLLPFSIITVTGMDGNEREVRLFPIFHQQTTDVKTGQLVGSGEVERYFADCNCGDFFLVQHRVFQKILWAYDFFYLEDR